MRITYSRLARHDLDEVWNRIAKESSSTEVADRLLESIQNTCNRLRRSPYIGRKRDEDFGMGMRSHPSGNYIVFYKVKSGTVRVIRILHGKRDIPAILSEE